MCKNGGKWGVALHLCIVCPYACVHSSDMGAANSAQNYSVFEEDLLMAAGGGGNNNNTGGTAILQLTPTQSCSLHGWANPKRTLAWEDLVQNPKITLRKCIDEVHTENSFL